MDVRALVKAGNRRHGHTNTRGIEPGRTLFKGFLGETRGVWQDRWPSYGMPPMQIVASEPVTTAKPMEPQKEVAQEVTTIAAPC